MNVVLKELRVADVGRARAEYVLRRRALEQLSVAFGGAAMQAMLVKGAGLAETVYAKPWLRQMGDIDILVPLADRDAAIDLLLAAGCELVPLGRGRRISGLASGTRQLVIRVGRLCWEIDLHTRLDKIVGRDIDYAAVFERAQPLADRGLPGLMIPSAEDHVLLLVIHAAAAEFCHAATWCDLELLLAGDVDTARLFARAKDWQLLTSLHVVLRTLTALGSQHPLDPIIDDSAPAWLRRTLLSRMYRIGEFPVARRPREQGWRWILRQLPLRDDALRWCAGVMVYGWRRVADRVRS
jgi:hypothetical protein